MKNRITTTIRIFKSINFNKWMNKNKLTDQVLLKIVKDITRGLINAELGNNLIKQRIALFGKGKRSGARILVSTNKKDRYFFIDGYKKNEQEDISPEEKIALREISLKYLSLTGEQLAHALEKGNLTEIKVNGNQI